MSFGGSGILANCLALVILLTASHPAARVGAILLPLWALARSDVASTQFALTALRALLAAGVLPARTDWTGVALFLRQGSIPPPYTHVEGVRFLMPGHFVRMGPRASECSPRRYWRLSFVPDREAVADPVEAARSVESAIRLSVRRRLRADVPIAAFLSGGLDSSLVAAVMKQEGAGDLQTFTVTLPGQAGDEAARAREVARHIGTRHTEIPLHPDDSAEWLLEAIDAMDVPSYDGPNTWLVSRAVRREGIKVACSGLGGDELFFGYPSFRTVPSVHRALAFARRLSAPRWAARRFARSLPASPRLGRILDAVLSDGSFAASWLMMRGLFSEGTVRDLLPEARLKEATLVDPIARIEGLGLPHGVSSRRMVSFLETSVYLHDQLLRDSDAMSMSHALELRVPLIGLPVVEAVSRLSGAVLAGARPKALLARMARSLLPHRVLEGPKQGFTLNWQRLLPALQAELAARPRFLSSRATERIWDAWRHGRLGFGYPFGLLVLERRLAALSGS